MFLSQEVGIASRWRRQGRRCTQRRAGPVLATCRRALRRFGVRRRYFTGITKQRWPGAKLLFRRLRSRGRACAGLRAHSSGGSEGIGDVCADTGQRHEAALAWTQAVVSSRAEPREGVRRIAGTQQRRQRGDGPAILSGQCGNLSSS